MNEKKYVGSGIDTPPYYTKLLVDLLALGEVITGKDGKKYLRLPDSPAIVEGEYNGKAQLTLKLTLGLKKSSSGRATHWIALDEWQPAAAAPAAAPEKDEDEVPF